jgi:regulator of protease activity HflC (stomatin/prohibitin superfamily)
MTRASGLVGQAALIRSPRFTVQSSRTDAIMALLESGMLLFWPLIVVILIVGLLSFFTVQTAQVAVITRFGKFLRVAEPGLNWKWPFIDRVAGRVSLRVNQITLTMETKTKDNVFVTIPISVQNRVRPEKVYDAFYKLSDPMQQTRPMSSRSFSAMCPA